ncbi:MAG: acetate kinase [Clostridiales bacterium]|nr:acetate kinase [Clostridiales bacterium]
MKVLVINAGSSSLKYQVIDMDNETMLCKGLVERIGTEGSKVTHQTEGKERLIIIRDLKNHTDALKIVIRALTDKTHGLLNDINEIDAVGHRVLHSGEDFADSVVIDEEVVKICKKNAVLGPLHMPANIACIESCHEVMPNVPMVAVFDTVFHSTMPRHAFMYAIPYEYYEKDKIRKYGFHGTSHKYVSGEALKKLKTDKCKMITCHLGNGSSLSAVVDGKCVDTSMGLTPLEGVIMGTRSGDLDPAVVEFLAQSRNLTVEKVLSILNKKSGFLGLSGKSDFRDLSNAALQGDDRAMLTVDMFAYRIKKYIGSYVAAMGGLDCIVFTGGIGENAHYARERIMQGMECFGIDFDFEYNEIAPRGEYSELHKPTSKVKVLVIPTNEELVIARDAKRLTAK